MSTSILLARDHLRQRYRERLGPTFHDFAPDIQAGDRDAHGPPAWIWVDAGLRPAEMPHGGRLMDAEIRTSLYLLPFLPETRLSDQLARAAGIATGREDAQDPGATTDASGPARVVVHWLVAHTDLFRWVQEIGRIQAETDHLDAVAVDAVVGRENDWKTALERHGFPRLLLTTRQVLGRSERSQVEAWSSADARVREVVAALPAAIPEEPAHAHAREVAERFQAPGTARPDRPTETSSRPGSEPDARRPGRPFLRFSVRHFRNLDHVSFGLGERPGVNATVIHGPNGTGKSNVAEAMALALSGSSHRYVDFIQDRNVTNQLRSKRYLNDYLRPTRSMDEVWPAAGFDGEPELPLELSEPAEARTARARLNGTVLEQDDSTAFLTWDAADLGSHVMGHASRLAAEVLDHVQERLDEARTHRLAFLRRWNLSSSLRKVATMRERVAIRVLATQLPEPAAVVGWLSNPAFANLPALEEAQGLAAEWSGWNDALSLAGTRVAGDETGREPVIAEIQARHARLTGATRAWLESVRARARTWPPDLADQIARAGEALVAAEGRPRDAAGHEPGPEDHERDRLIREDAALGRELREVEGRGRQLRAERDHVETVIRQLEGGELDGRCCPTCGTDLGGADRTVAAARDRQARIDRELAHARQRYREIAARRSRFEIHLTRPGAGPDTAPPAVPAAVRDVAAWLGSAGADPLEPLRDPALRATIVHAVKQLAAVPEMPEPARDESAGTTVAADLREAFQDVYTATTEEAAWNTVHQTLTSSLSHVVKEHLPATLGALWGELVWNLTPAPWQVRHRPEFAVRTARNQPRAVVAMDVAGEMRHARYLLNEAEIRTLGLAWFFARYITHGRFEHALLVLDDPTAAMDEPTFRDFTAFQRALLAMHRSLGRPLTLITLLHDDRRAAVAAAHVGASLLRLRWNDGQGVLVDADQSSTRRVED